MAIQMCVAITLTWSNTFFFFFYLTILQPDITGYRGRKKSTFLK